MKIPPTEKPSASVTSPAASTLADWLARHLPEAKRQTLKRMVESKRVTINGKPATRLKQAIAPRDVVKVLDLPKRKNTLPEPKEFQIIHEDEDFIVLNKPAGLLTSTVPREPRVTLVALLRDYFTECRLPSRVGVIHRLDRGASGLLIFSKNDAAYRSLKQQFFKHTVERIYMAVVEGTPPPRGKIESYLIELNDGRVRSTRQPGKGQRAVTTYIVVKQEPRRALLRLTLHTGHKHQIRVHLSERGTPVVGDSMYAEPPKGKRKALPPPGPLMLTAVHLAFDHPRTGKRVIFEVPIPSAMGEALAEKIPKP